MGLKGGFLFPINPIFARSVVRLRLLCPLQLFRSGDISLHAWTILCNFPLNEPEEGVCESNVLINFLFSITSLQISSKSIVRALEGRHWPWWMISLSHVIYRCWCSSNGINDINKMEYNKKRVHFQSWSITCSLDLRKK